MIPYLVTHPAGNFCVLSRHDLITLRKRAGFSCKVKRISWQQLLSYVNVKKLRLATVMQTTNVTRPKTTRKTVLAARAE